MQSSGISLQPVSICAICLLENTGRNGQVYTCVTMAGAKQNVQALRLDGPIRVHIHCYGRCPRLQTRLGQGTAAARVSHHTPGIVLLSITSSLSNSASVSACGVLSGKIACFINVEKQADLLHYLSVEPALQVMQVDDLKELNYASWHTKRQAYTPALHCSRA